MFLAEQPKVGDTIKIIHYELFDADYEVYDLDIKYQPVFDKPVYLNISDDYVYYNCFFVPAKMILREKYNESKNQFQYIY